jgi:hypothetical protein
VEGEPTKVKLFGRPSSETYVYGRVEGKQAIILIYLIHSVTLVGTCILSYIIRYYQLIFPFFSIAFS